MKNHKVLLASLMILTLVSMLFAVTLNASADAKPTNLDECDGDNAMPKYCVMTPHTPDAQPAQVQVRQSGAVKHQVKFIDVHPALLVK